MKNSSDALPINSIVPEAILTAKPSNATVQYGGSAPSGMDRAKPRTRKISIREMPTMIAMPTACSDSTMA